MNDNTTVATKESLETAIAALKERGFEPLLVQTKAEALEAIKKLIPEGATVMNGSSRTLDEIGFIEYLKSGTHAWSNLHAAILAEKDPVAQSKLRKGSVLADFFLTSVHAVSEDGRLVIASASGSQLPSVEFTSPNVILVVGAQKIVPTLEEALKRVREYVFPLEDARMKATGAPGSMIGKLLIYEREGAFLGRHVHVLLVNEALGF